MKSRRTPIQNLLSHPTWAGIAGIAAILSVIIAFIAYRSTSSNLSSIPPTSNKSTVAIVTSPSLTPTPVLTSTPSINNVTPTSTSIQANGGVITANQWVPCTQCDTPIRIRLNSITINTSNANTTWAVTLTNNSGAAQGESINSFNLQDEQNHTLIGTGDKVISYENILNAGQSRQDQIIIPFLPSPGQSYTLNVALYVAGSYSQVFNYDPLLITFTQNGASFSYSPTTQSSTITAKTLQINQWLACTNCNTPIRFRLNTITINTSNANTTWVVTLVNNSGAAQGESINSFNLQDTQNHTLIGTGDKVISYEYILNSEQTQQDQIIIPFLPSPGGHYTLNVALYVAGSYSQVFHYDSFSLSF